MGAGMDKIMPGLFVGSIRDSKDIEQIKEHNITHILTIYEDPKPGGINDITYKCFKASDHASQDIKQFFADAVDFIHEARLQNGTVLVHCLAGVSRSTTLAIAYIMTVIEMPWYDSLNVVRRARKGANPNFGFQRQLQNYEFTTLKAVRQKLFEKHGVYEKAADLQHCKQLLEQYHQANAEAAAESVKQKEQTTAATSGTAVKTYPFAFNQYNMDAEENGKKKKLPEKVTTKVKPRTTAQANTAGQVNDRTNAVIETSQLTQSKPVDDATEHVAPTEDVRGNADLVAQADKTKEKDEIINKIFG